MYIDADADDCEGYGVGLGVRFDQDAADFAGADEEVVGPTEVGVEAGGGMDGGGGGESGSQGHERQAEGRDLRAEKDADVEAAAGGGVPGVACAATAG